MAKATKKAEARTATAKNINLNKVNVTGRLTKDTEILKIQNKERYIVKGVIAVNKTYKGKEHVSFIDFEMFTDNPVEMKKGQKIYLEGRVVSDEWKNEKGEYRSKTKIQAFNIIPTEISGNDLNSVIITGRLVKDPVVISVKEGRSVIKFRIAINRNYKQNEKWKQDTEYIDVSHFGSTEYVAKVAAKIGKGKFVWITGELLQEKWQNENGENRTKVSVVAETLNLSYVSNSKTSPSEPSEENNTKESEVVDIESEIEDIDVDEIETPF